MHRRVVWLSVGMTLCCLGCSEPLQGPNVPIPELIRPDPLPSPPAPPPVPPRVAPSLGRQRAWIPPEVTANGDRTLGHWIELGEQGPLHEAVEPEKTLPTVPRYTVSPTKKEKPARTPRPAETPPPPVAPPLGQPQSNPLVRPTIPPVLGGMP